VGGPDVVFYDAQCGLCQWSVRFLLARDDGSRFRFAPLGGATFAQSVPEAEAQLLPDSMAILAGNRLLVRSDAVLHLLRRLGGGWALLAAGSAPVPRSWRDGLYAFIANNRHRVFRPGQDACPVMPLAWRERFLP
jgi:predicted DCC family thiol-disulfide oxidoreductase YuxK